MFEVGDKVVVVSAEPDDNCAVGDVLKISEISDTYGFWAETPHGWETYAMTKEMIGGSSVIVKPYTEAETKIEAERRGAKFGVMGVSKITGRKIRFVTDDGKKSLNGQPLWVFLNEETQSIMRLRPSGVRFDHEPEFVAWSEAPEHLRYDASRVYFDGKPVKWIAKPEGSNSGVAYVDFLGTVMGSSSLLTVKL